MRFGVQSAARIVGIDNPPLLPDHATYGGSDIDRVGEILVLRQLVCAGGSLLQKIIRRFDEAAWHVWSLEPNHVASYRISADKEI